MSTAANILQFSYGARPPDVEKAYREHYLGTDVRQLKNSVFVISALLLVLSILDLLRLPDQPELLLGLAIKVCFLVFGIGMVLMCQKKQRAAMLDFCVLIYAGSYATAIIMSHFINDYAPARIVAVVLIFIFTAHIALPVYASYLVPADLIILSGESYLLFTEKFDSLEMDKPVIVAIYLFALVMSIFVSAAQQRARFEIFQALKEVKTLSGFLPICASCKAIRNDEGYYEQIELYISERSDAEFTHGICPVCAEKLLGYRKN